MLASGIGEFAPVQARQADVGHEKVDRGGRFNDPEATCAVTCLQRRVAEVLQNLDDELAHDGIVFHDEDPLLASRARRQVRTAGLVDVFRPPGWGESLGAWT